MNTSIDDKTPFDKWVVFDTANRGWQARHGVITFDIEAAYRFTHAEIVERVSTRPTVPLCDAPVEIYYPAPEVYKNFAKELKRLESVVYTCDGTGCFADNGQVNDGQCPVQSAGDTYLCTRAEGHEGPHIACGTSQHNLHIWDQLSV